MPTESAQLEVTPNQALPFALNATKEARRSNLPTHAHNAALALLRGMGQIMLQENALTGALFLAGIAANSVIMFAGAMVGLLSGTITAQLLRFNRDEIHRGLYGFNGALVGIAMCFFYQPSPTTFLVALLGGAFSSLVMNAFMRKNLPAYTAPFILVTWMVMWVCNTQLHLAVVNHGGVPHKLDMISAIFEGYGQVMFQGSLLSGALFAAGILLNSRRDSITALLGAALGVGAAMFFKASPGQITIGLFGYNAILCSIALSGPTRAISLLAIAGSAPLLIWFQKTGFVALTAPFVLATWMACAIDRVLGGRR